MRTSANAPPLTDQVRGLTGLDESAARTALAAFGLRADLATQRRDPVSR
jgi:hypothetical protein